MEAAITYHLVLFKIMITRQREYMGRELALNAADLGLIPDTSDSP